jgi:hypothetical protein
MQCCASKPQQLPGAQLPIVYEFIIYLHCANSIRCLTVVSVLQTKTRRELNVKRVLCIGGSLAAVVILIMLMAGTGQQAPRTVLPANTSSMSASSRHAADVLLPCALKHFIVLFSHEACKQKVICCFNV